MVWVRMTVFRTDLCPVYPAVGVSAHFRIQIFDQIGRILRISARQAVYIDDL